MARILTVTDENASEQQRQLLDRAKATYGIVPGILQIRLVDPEMAGLARQVYDRLHMRPDSRMSRLQREMLATVVNGLIGGAP